jgi:putative phosphoribosyl transferase
MFKDRKDAGLQLGKALLKFKADKPLIIGIPRGGLETAYYVAHELQAEMIPVISRKLGYPHNPEFAMGALAEDGSLYLSPLARQRVSKDDINQAMEWEREEIKRRVALLRPTTPIPTMKGRTVIVVDDGIATGATLFATLKLCQKHQPKKLIVAAPNGASETINKLNYEADEVIVLEVPQDFLCCIPKL